MVADFGYANLQATTATAWRRIGTDLYRAPEQSVGTLHTKAMDCYAFGIMLYLVRTVCTCVQRARTERDLWCRRLLVTKAARRCGLRTNAP